MALAVMSRAPPAPLLDERSRPRDGSGARGYHRRAMQQRDEEETLEAGPAESPARSASRATRSTVHLDDGGPSVTPRSEQVELVESDKTDSAHPFAEKINWYAVCADERKGVVIEARGAWVKLREPDDPDAGAQPAPKEFSVAIGSIPSCMKRKPRNWHVPALPSGGGGGAATGISMIAAAAAARGELSAVGSSRGSDSDDDDDGAPGGSRASKKPKAARAPAKPQATAAERSKTKSVAVWAGNPALERTVLPLLLGLKIVRTAQAWMAITFATER